MTHLFLDCSYFRNNFKSPWNELNFKIDGSNPTDGAYIYNFIENLDGHNRVPLLLRGGGRRLALPFDNETDILVIKFILSTLSKIHKLPNERLHEIEAPWLVNR